MDDIDLKALNHKQMMFVHHYLKSHNATQSYKDAGYTVANDNVAAVAAHQLLRNYKIKPIIQLANQQRLRAVKCDAEWVLTQLKAQYEFNIDDFIKINDHGKPTYDFSKATPEQMHCIDQIDISPTEWGTKIKVKTMGKKSILEMIGKHTNIEAFKDKIELSGDVTVVFDENDRNA